MVASVSLPVDVHGRGVLASRPAAGMAGREYFATDNGTLYRDNGTSWDTVTFTGSLSLTFGGTGDMTAEAFGSTVSAGSSGKVSDAGHRHAMPADPTGLPLGLTGATSATRYVGATASGAPVSGTFAVGDFIIDRSGTIYICTAAGTPGTWAAPSGGGGGPTDYVSGASGTGHINIPGLFGSPDIRVAGTNDDEFDTTDTSDPMTGWTTLGTPTAHDINSTAKSHYYVSKAAAASVNWAGIYKTPPSFPMTVTAKLADLHGVSQFNAAGLFIGPATPGALDMLAYGSPDANGPGRIALVNYSSPTAFNAVIVSAVITGGPPIYLRITVTSSTNVAYFWSLGGLSWHQMTSGRNPSMTVAAVGLAAMANNASVTGEAFFDWIRFT